MSKFKAGDLALVVGCVRNPKNIGKAVELLEEVWPGEGFTDPSGSFRIAEPVGDRPFWLAASDDLVSIEGKPWGLFEESHLMPLRGDFQPEQQKSREVPA
jgi:hypothetical protein